MTIWLLALLLLASLAALGYRQGAIRVAFSLVGISLGALLASPLGRLLKPALKGMGVSNPVLLWLLAPLIVFLIISLIFKAAALVVHQKVDVHYKYHAGELRLALWERVNRRLGLALGLVNGTLYLLLLSVGIYSLSYWTVQMAATDSDPRSVRILNRLGRDLDSSGLAKAAAAIASMPPEYYDTADITGLIYYNPLLEARLSRYPAFLGLAERPEFQDIANDKDFTEMRLRREPIMTVIAYPKVQAIINNNDLLKSIWATVIPDLKDLRVFLETGQSPKYDQEKLLGRWNFDVNSAMAIMRRAKPNLTSTDMQKYKKWMIVAFAKTSLVAATDHHAFLKNVPQLRPAAGATAEQTLPGEWKRVEGNEGKYELTFSGAGRQDDYTGIVEGDRLSLTNAGFGLAFNREN